MRWTIPIFGIAFLAGCDPVPSGDFCDIARPDFYASAVVADYLTENDPEHVRRDVAENEYGAENCGDDWLTR